MKKSSFLLFFIWMMISYWAEAQSFYAIRRERSLIAVAGSGTSTYFGDLKPSGDVMDFKAAISGGLQYYFTPTISGRAEFTYFTLAGSDTDDNLYPYRNLSFTSGNFELNVVGMINLLPMGRRFYQRPTANVYGFAGIGLMYMNPKAEYNGKKYALQPLKTENVEYSRLQPVLPYGVGVRFKAGPFFSIALEAGWRMTFTDYMDDVSTVHPDKTGWTDPVRRALSDRSSGAIFQAGDKRGNPEANDNYYFTMVKVEYYLPNNFLFNESQRKNYNKNRRRAAHR